MNATTAGEPGRTAGAAPQRRTGAAPGRRVLSAGPGPRAGAAGRGAPAVPGPRVVAPVPRQRTRAVPGQPHTAADPRARAGAARQRPPVLTVVPLEPAVAAELPGALAPGRDSGVEQRVRRVTAGGPRPAGARGRPRSRLTRRGRIVVSALVLAAMLAVAALAWIAGAAKADAAGSGGSSSAAVYRHLTPVVVAPGESLWTIAAQAEPSADPRSVIQEIIDINALAGTSVQPGQRLWVPRG